MRYPLPATAPIDVTAFTPGVAPESATFDGFGIPESGDDHFASIEASPEFNRLRTTLLRFVFPMTGIFLGWYLLYVLLAAYAHSFMSYRLWGQINIGLLLGLLQFVSTAVITVWYARFARKRVDPEVAAIRAKAGVAQQ